MEEKKRKKKKARGDKKISHRGGNTLWGKKKKMRNIEGLRILFFGGDSWRSCYYCWRGFNPRISPSSAKNGEKRLGKKKNNSIFHASV